MSDPLRELYQTTILDHNKKPRNFHVLPDAQMQADGHNPLCGDQLTVYVNMEGDRVSEIAFQGKGCAISVAAASLMTDTVKGETLEQVEKDFQKFHEVVTSSPDVPIDLASLDKLAVFSGVREFPVRVKCATLAWHTLRAALNNDSKAVKTE